MKYSTIVLTPEESNSLLTKLTDENYSINNLTNDYVSYDNKYDISLKSLLKINDHEMPLVNIADNSKFFDFNSLIFIFYCSSNSENIFNISNIKIKFEHNSQNDPIIITSKFTKINEYSKFGIAAYTISFYKGNNFLTRAIDKISSSIYFTINDKTVYTIKVNNDLYYYNIETNESNSTIYIKFNLNKDGALINNIFKRIFTPSSNSKKINYSYNNVDVQNQIDNFYELFTNFKSNGYFILNLNDKKYIINSTFTTTYDIYDFAYFVCDSIIEHLNGDDILCLLHDKEFIVDNNTDDEKEYKNCLWDNVKNVFNNTIISPSQILTTGTNDIFYNGYYDIIFNTKGKNNTTEILYNLENEIVLIDTKDTTFNDYNLYYNNDSYHKKLCLSLYKKYIKNFMIDGNDDDIEELFLKYNITPRYLLIDSYNKIYHIEYTLKLK